MKNTKENRGVLFEILNTMILLGVTVLGGIFAAYLAARLNGEPFGLYTWPFIACTALFAFATVGFFKTEKGAEALYLVCAVASAACGLVQLAILF